jgi:hypothetical protein
VHIVASPPYPKWWQYAIFMITLKLKIEKAKLSHYTPWLRMVGGRYKLVLIHDLGTRWGLVVSVTPRLRLNLGEGRPGTHCTGGWVGLIAGLDTEARGITICPCRLCGFPFVGTMDETQIPWWRHWCLRAFFFMSCGDRGFALDCSSIQAVVRLS